MNQDIEVLLDGYARQAPSELPPAAWDAAIRRGRRTAKARLVILTTAGVVSLGSVLASAVALTGTAHAPGRNSLKVTDDPTRSAAPTSLPTCGRVPMSTGPSKDSLELRVQGPGTAPSGTTVMLEVVMTARIAGPVDYFTGSPPAVLVAVGDQVVGRYDGAVGGVGRAGHLTPGQAATFPASVLLSGCSRHPDPAHPDASREPLPPGQYQLVAVMEDGNGQGNIGSLVSEPLPVVITASTAAQESPSTDPTHALSLCLKLYPSVRKSEASTAGSLRSFGPVPSPLDLAHRHFAALPDDAFVALCLVPTTQPGHDDVYGVPDDTTAAEHLWTQGGSSDFLRPV